MKKRLNLLLLPLLLNSAFALASNDQITTRVVGGNDTSVEDWPWMVFVHAGNLACGGTLIDATTVMTAAHCLYDENDNEIPAEQITIIAGESHYPDLTTPDLAITKTYIHSDYSPFYSDIALLTLATRITDITPLDRADNLLTSTAIASQNEVTLIGWGWTEGYEPGDMDQTIPVHPDILQEANISLKTDQQCSDMLSYWYQPSTQLCAGEDAIGACHGDSGGPLVVYSEGNWKQVGIASSTIGCAVAEYPAFYTRIATFNDWIDNILINVSIDSPMSFEFTDINVNQAQDLIIRNNAATDIALTFTLTGDAAFSIDTNSCATVVANTTCLLPVIYTPTEFIASEAILSIASDLQDSEIISTTLSGAPVATNRSSGSSGGGSLFFILSLPLLCLRRRFC